MRIDIYNEESLVIIKLIGRYDIEEVYDFGTLLQDQINKDFEVIALNLSELSYIDSSGIGSLIRCMNTASRKGIDFICYNLNQNIENTFKLAKIDQFISIFTEETFKEKYINSFN
ncbi:MAG: STAS domain-containing protein [Spirochaetota bacterium]|nr:STAS domain-containing protein [Spirochaetota bacterium]